MTPELHLILDLDSERAQLFEPRADPREARDVAGRRPQELKELRGVLDRYASERRPRKPATLDEVPDELTEQLRALGYVE
jgi:hypothetical protein